MGNKKDTEQLIGHEFTKETPPKKGQYKVVLYGPEAIETIATYTEVNFKNIGIYHCGIHDNDIATDVRLGANIEE